MKFSGLRCSDCPAYRVEDVIAAQEPLPLSRDTSSWASSLEAGQKSAVADGVDNVQHEKAMAEVITLTTLLCLAAYIGSVYLPLVFEVFIDIYNCKVGVS